MSPCRGYYQTTLQSDISSLYLFVTAKQTVYCGVHSLHHSLMLKIHNIPTALFVLEKYTSLGKTYTQDVDVWNYHNWCY